MYYPFAIQNRNRIVRLIAVLYLVLFLAEYFPGSVWGESENDYAQQFRRQGLEAQKQGEFGKALLYYSRAAAYLPKDPSIQNDMGLMFERLGRLDPAEASYRAAIEKDSRYLPAYSNLGILLKKRGRYELAAMYLQRRIELGGVSDPWMLNAQEELENLYSLAPYLKNKRTLESAAELERQIARDRSLTRAAKVRTKKISYELSMKKGLAAFKAGDYPASVTSFEDALRLYPDSTEALHSLLRAKAEVRKAEVAASLQVSAEENRPMFVDRELNAAEGKPEPGTEPAEDKKP